MNNFIPVNEPLLDGNEKKYLIECIETGWISSEGPYVKKFEQSFAAQITRKHGVAVTNGSVALDIAVTALGIGPGDEVIMPTFTIISCAAAIVRTGARPVLVDSDPFTWNMDVNQLENKINANTKAIMVVHIYGLPVDMAPVLSLAEKYDLMIIEDAAEAHGLEYGQGSQAKPCGSFGTISTFSFYPNKHITTGEGGLIATDDEQLAEKCRSLRNLCFQPHKRFIHEELGWNSRFTNLQAAVGLAQLEKLNEHIQLKRKMGKMYNQMLAGIKELQLPRPTTEYAENIYWVYGLVLGDGIPLDADAAMRRLQAKKIGTRPFFWPMHEQPVFRKMGLFQNETYPVAERIARKGFYIPSGLTLAEDQIAYVAECIHQIL